MGIGEIFKSEKDNSIRYVVSSLSGLIVIINHFDKYSLITQKLGDYLLFKRALDLISKKEHITLEGLQKILAIKASMNLGLSNEIKAAFPEIIPIQRPLVNNTKIPDPH